MLQCSRRVAARAWLRLGIMSLGLFMRWVRVNGSSACERGGATGVAAGSALAEDKYVVVLVWPLLESTATSVHNSVK